MQQLKMQKIFMHLWLSYVCTSCCGSSYSYGLIFLIRVIMSKLHMDMQQFTACSLLGEFWGWTPKLTRRHMKWTPAISIEKLVKKLRNFSKTWKHTLLPLISTQLSSRQHISMILHSKQQTNKTKKKQATKKSVNMNHDNDNGSMMLHAFCGKDDILYIYIYI